MAILFTASHQEKSTDASYEQTKRKTRRRPSSTSESPLPTIKSVRFASSLIQEHIISTITDKTSDEWKAMIYSKIELNAIIRKNQRLLMRHKRNKFDDNDDNRNYSLRGLEASSGKENKTRNERHSRAVHKVISTQKEFTENFNTTSLDDNQSTRDTIIAQSYMSACEECRDEALQRGLKDERVVRTLNSIPGKKDRNNGSSKKKLSQRKGGIRDILHRPRQRSP
jgi:hypothetical protein